MLLGATNSNTQQHNYNDDFIAVLLRDNRYAEAYELLTAAPAEQVSTQYNLALCHFWVENYREALLCLDKARMLLPTGPGKPNLNSDGFYKAIRNKQNQLDDYKQAITQRHVELTGTTVADAIIRLKTDCWLQLQEYAKVIDTATPIAYKNYRNITGAISIAKTKI